MGDVIVFRSWQMLTFRKRRQSSLALHRGGTLEFWEKQGSSLRESSTWRNKDHLHKLCNYFCFQPLDVQLFSVAVFCTLAVQVERGQLVPLWHGAAHGWPQSGRGSTQGCWQPRSAVQSPLWQIRLQECISHGSALLHVRPHEMSCRWHGMLLRCCKDRRDNYGNRKHEMIHASERCQRKLPHDSPCTISEWGMCREDTSLHCGSCETLKETNVKSTVTVCNCCVSCHYFPPGWSHSCLLVHGFLHSGGFVPQGMGG